MKTEQVTEQYKKLCQWCDQFFLKVNQHYKEEMQCEPGCDSCCTLETVTLLEAAVISDFIKEQQIEKSPDAVQGMCVFLKDGICSIYPVRPIICRTHGLLLLDNETNEVKRSCHLNFNKKDILKYDSQYTLDMHKITENLIRFNLLYGMLTGEKEEELERIPLLSLF